MTAYYPTSILVNTNGESTRFYIFFIIGDIFCKKTTSIKHNKNSSTSTQLTVQKPFINRDKSGIKQELHPHLSQPMYAIELSFRIHCTVKS